MGTVTKKKLINAISQDKKMNPADVRTVVQSFLDLMTDCLSEGERLEFRDFGVFEVVLRKQKIGRNPKNAEVPIVIPERNAVKFTPGKKMRNSIGSSKPDSSNKPGCTNTSSKPDFSTVGAGTSNTSSNNWQ